MYWYQPSVQPRKRDWIDFTCRVTPSLRHFTARPSRAEPPSETTITQYHIENLRFRAQDGVAVLGYTYDLSASGHPAPNLPYGSPWAAWRKPASASRWARRSARRGSETFARPRSGKTVGGNLQACAKIHIEIHLHRNNDGRIEADRSAETSFML